MDLGSFCIHKVCQLKCNLIRVSTLKTYNMVEYPFWIPNYLDLRSSAVDVFCKGTYLVPLELFLVVCWIGGLDVRLCFCHNGTATELSGKFLTCC